MSKHHGAGRSEAGGAGEINEDSFFADDGLGLYVVCDGAGGAAAGAIASRIAVDAVSSYIEHADEIDGRPDIFANALATRAMQHAFARIAAKEASTPAWRGMNTTLTMLLVRHRRAVVGHVGDSRLYLVRDDALHQLTVDHPLTNRTIGDPSLLDTLEPDTFRFPLYAGDTLVLCTDGLNDVMGERDWVVQIASSSDLGWIADQLLAREDQVGRRSDATVVIIRIDEDNHRPRLSHYINQDFDLFQSFPLSAANAC